MNKPSVVNQGLFGKVGKLLKNFWLVRLLSQINELTVLPDVLIDIMVSLICSIKNSEFNLATGSMRGKKVGPHTCNPP